MQKLQRRYEVRGTYVIVLVKELLQELVTRMIELCGAANGNPQPEQESTVIDVQTPISVLLKVVEGHDVMTTQAYSG